MKKNPVFLQPGGVFPPRTVGCPATAENPIPKNPQKEILNSPPIRENSLFFSPLQRSAMSSSSSDPELTLTELTEKLHQGTSLTVPEARSAAAALASPTPNPQAKENFLIALSGKGETPDEVFAFAEEFRSRSVDPGLGEFSEAAIDVVGTGGDRSGTFNFSTATALLLASMEIPVMKHGNRSITSKSGSADLLAALGVPMENRPDYLRKSLEKFHFCFFFAPSFHPAFKEIMPVRKKLGERGIKTIFNLLGPLINPGRPAQQLLGVFSEDWVAPLATALDRLGLHAALVVHSRINQEQGVDELTTAGVNRLQGAGALKGAAFPSSASEFGLTPSRLEDLRGGEAVENLETLNALAAGRLGGALLDTLCLNAGAALLTCHPSSSIQEGIAKARAAIQEGRFQRWLENFTTFNHSHS